MTKNPYDNNTPEWQLYENMVSSESQARAYASDAENYQCKSEAAREKAERFRVALAKLTETP